MEVLLAKRIVSASQLAQMFDRNAHSARQAIAGSMDPSLLEEFRDFAITRGDLHKLMSEDPHGQA
jgi:hypothetical protein